MSYKLEMHVHHAPVSACAQASAEELVASCLQAGYTGVVSTNHINLSTFREGKEDLPWEAKVEYFLSGYEQLKAVAGKDLDVLLGCEINLSLPGQRYISNDYLVYGVTPEWLLASGDLRFIDLKELSRRVREAGLMIVQAHPFRYGCILERETLLDGLEVCNAHVRHDSHNDLTALWAKKTGLPGFSGSDYHQVSDPIHAGIRTQERIRDNDTLLRTLRAGTYELIIPGPQA